MPIIFKCLAVGSWAGGVGGVGWIEAFGAGVCAESSMPADTAFG